MPMYNGREIAANVYTNFHVDNSGNVTERFGWNGEDCFRFALLSGLNKAMDMHEDEYRKIKDQHSKLSRKWFKNNSDITQLNVMSDFMVTSRRCIDECDLLCEYLSNHHNEITDDVVDRCKTFINITRLDLDQDYEVLPALHKWNERDTNNRFYRVENDYSLSVWHAAGNTYSRINNILHISYMLVNTSSERTATGMFNDKGNYIDCLGLVYYNDINEAKKVAIERGTTEINRIANSIEQMK